MVVPPPAALAAIALAALALTAPGDGQTAVVELRKGGYRVVDGPAHGLRLRGAIADVVPVDATGARESPEGAGR